MRQRDKHEPGRVRSVPGERAAGETRGQRAEQRGKKEDETDVIMVRDGESVLRLGQLVNLQGSSRHMQPVAC